MFQVRITHKKPGGKVVTSKEVVKGAGQGIRVQPYKEEDRSKVLEEEVDESIGNLTTFSLSTSQEAELKAKEGLVLPFYTEEQKRVVGLQEQGQVVIQGEKKGAIYYEPDSGDDWDDDDPDDDLDF